MSILMASVLVASGAVRAVVDMGSSTTKLKVARVDLDHGQIVEVLYPRTEAERVEAQVKLPFKTALLAGADGTLPAALVDQARTTLRTFRRRAESFGAGVPFGVATDAFRKAANGPAVLEQLRRETGVRLAVVSQAEEARLGHLAAVAASGAAPADVVAWDIGGGSQQISVPVGGHLGVYAGQLGSDVFKRRVTREVLERAGETPNPLGARGVAGAWEMARAVAREVPGPIRRRLASPGSRIVGIGGVHLHVLRERTGQEVYDLASVRRAMERLKDLDDAAIGGRFPANDVINLVLVGAFMEELGISAVHVRDAAIGDGLLLDAVPRPRPAGQRVDVDGVRLERVVQAAPGNLGRFAP